MPMKHSERKTQCWEYIEGEGWRPFWIYAYEFECDVEDTNDLRAIAGCGKQLDGNAREGWHICPQHKNPIFSQWHARAVTRHCSGLSTVCGYRSEKDSLYLCHACAKKLGLEW